MFRLGTKSFIFLVTLMLLPTMAAALEYRSVAVAKAILYDAPSGSAKKVLLLSQNYPVEIIVNLGDWLKVRDAKGSISWVEAKQLSDKRTLMVTAGNAEIRAAADGASSLVATLEKDVVLELADPKPINGWLKVKHRDGLTGYIPIASVWGFN